MARGAPRTRVHRLVDENIAVDAVELLARPAFVHLRQKQFYFHRNITINISKNVRFCRFHRKLSGKRSTVATGSRTEPRRNYRPETSDDTSAPNAGRKPASNCTLGIRSAAHSTCCSTAGSNILPSRAYTTHHLHRRGYKIHLIHFS